MAIVTTSAPLDMLAPDYFPGFPGAPLVDAGPVSLTYLEASGATAVLGGSFVIGGGGPQSGLVTTIAETLPGGAPHYAIDGVSISFEAYAGFRAAGDAFGLLFQVMAGNDVLNGSGGADRLVGLDGNDTVSGGAGDDDVNGNRGDDIVFGNAGADFARGGQGVDLVYGEEGDDWHVNGNIGNDTVWGGNGNDTVFGGQDDDVLFGEAGNDSILGNLGDDVLYGGGGDDILDGGPGSDEIWVDHGGGRDRVLGFDTATDILFYALNINGSDLGGTFEALLARLAPDGAGGTVFDLGAGQSVTFAGVAPGQFHVDNFVFFT